MRAMARAMAMLGRWQWQGGWRVTKRSRARVARAIETIMRVAGKEEGKGSKAMTRATRLAGERSATGMATVMKRAMATTTRLGGAWGGDDQLLPTK